MTKFPTDYARSLRFRAVAGGLAAALSAGAAQASHVDARLFDMSFSTDVQGPMAGTVMDDAFWSAPIYGTDILTPKDPGSPGPNPAGSDPNPGIFIQNPPTRISAAPGLAIDKADALDDTNGWGELDALSYGHDPMDTPIPPDNWYYTFSVDEFAIGQPNTAVRLEGALGNQQASADTFVTRKPPLPAPPGAGTNAYFTDGDNVAPSGAPGVGLIEPNLPTVGSGGAAGQIDPGDNLDAVDFETTLADRDGPVYFSLDSAFSDPLEVPGSAGGGTVPNYGTAAANGFVGGDVLVGTPIENPNPTPNPNPIPGGIVSVYAAAAQLGLDTLGAGSDDLDALKLWENGQAGYQPSSVPFDWMGGSTDMLLFSVRRGSALIGLLDSIFGISIEEGDVLTTPCAAGSVLGSGVVCTGGGLPGIFTAAEQLGLATVRSGVFASYGVVNPAYGADQWADDLDALDQVPVPGTLALLAFGFGGGLIARRRRRVAV